MQDIADISAKLAKHDNDSSDNASLPSNDADFSVPLSLGGAGEQQMHSVARPVLPNQSKVNIANGQITTSVKIEPRRQDGGGGIVKVADPVVAITGNDEM